MELTSMIKRVKTCMSHSRPQKEKGDKNEESNSKHFE